MLFNVFPLVNTCHALGFSAFLMVDALTFFRCHLEYVARFIVQCGEVANY